MLSVAAHGSDAEFMAGGTLARLAAKGHSVYLAIATNNQRSSHRLAMEDLKARAVTEAETAAAALGAREVFLLSHADGDLCDIQPSILRGQVMRLIRQVGASTVFCWDPQAPFESHPDHRAIAWATSDAARLAHLPLYHPEHLEDRDGGATPLAPQRVSEWYWYSRADWRANKVVDITDTLEQKLAALSAYDSQMGLWLDEFLAEARLSGIDDDQLAGMDLLEPGPWIEVAVRAIHSKLGVAEGMAYAETFRYESLEGRDLRQSL